MTGSASPPSETSLLHRLLQVDARSTARFNASNLRGPRRKILAFLAHSGDSWFMAPVMGAVWLLGDGLWKWRMLVLFGAMCITAVTAVAIKRLIGRRRPEGEWGLIYRSTDPHSFPSGHAARLFMLAVFSLHVGPTWLIFILFLWAPLVALARVAMGVHYFSDVIGGAVLGVAFGLLFLLII